MKTVLVTGSAGALGRAVIECLRKNELWRVVVTSRRCLDECDFQLDVCNREQIFSIIQSTKPDLVLHLAATFANDIDIAYAVNVEGTRHLLEAVQQTGFRSRVLLIGSAAEYGAVRPEENPVRENRVLNPVSIYGLTKAWQSQLAGLYASCGMDVVVARVFNLDGPGLSENLFVGRLQKQISEVLTGQKTAIELGPLAAIRDYIPIDEAADQILAIAAYGDSGRFYHVASGNPVKMRDMLIRYLAINKLDVSIVHEAPNLSNRIGYDVPVIYADIVSTLQLMRNRE
jgi:GDP-4-dehydro-6-deoxy-D-mannose reductase